MQQGSKSEITDGASAASAERDGFPNTFDRKLEPPCASFLSVSVAFKRSSLGVKFETERATRS